MVNSLGQLFLVTLAVLPFLSGCDVSDIPDVLHAFDSRCFPLADWLARSKVRTLKIPREMRWFSTSAEAIVTRQNP
jgi:hypothetical protein